MADGNPTQRNENPFDNPTIIEAIRNTVTEGPVKNLSLLRQLSSTICPIISPLYFDKLNKRIYVNPDGQISMVLNQKPKINDDDDDEEEFYGYCELKFINNENWNPEIAQIFRRLEISTYDFTSETVEDDNEIGIGQMIPFLCQHITQLVFHRILENRKMEKQKIRKFLILLSGNSINESDDENDSTEKDSKDEDDPNNPGITKEEYFRNLGNFIPKFYNLKKIIFHIHGFCPDFEDILPIIQNISPSIKILFMIYAKFDIIFDNYFFKNFIVNFKPFPNVKFHVNYGILREYKFTLFRNKKPFELLEKCPNLETLNLTVDQDACIFNNPEKTDEANILEFVSSIPNLENLKKFSFRGNNVKSKIQATNDLGIYFKSLIPESVEFSFGI